ncbi:MAG: dihydroneopterin aldolase [Candidatus Thalassarchaeaceae archaeon]|nr:dihydroneopterin aldolase [Candidatus Thalassarchaeaceae archaeon]MDP7042437.1 dihydroneopterin aldolase [Candidatus Thalassarchaeaceae archaeon]
MDSSELERFLMERVGFALTTLQLRAHIVDLEIGVLQEERGVTQRIRFDVDVYISGASQPIEDEIDRVLDYDFIIAAISNKVVSKRINLLESLVADLLDTLLVPAEVIACSVTATKLDIYRGQSEIGCRMMKLKDGFVGADI